MNKSFSVRWLSFCRLAICSWVIGEAASHQLAVAETAAERVGLVVGHMRDYHADDVGVIDSHVTLGAQKGLAEGYPDLSSAKAAAIALPGIEVVYQVSRSYTLYELRLIDNTPENDERRAKGDLAGLTEDSLDGIDYRKLKCVQDSELMLDAPPRGMPRAVNVVDGKGLFVASYRIRDVARGAKRLRMLRDKEIVNGHYLEAKETYLFLEDLNVKNQELEVVQATVRNNLTKFMQSESPELREFAESEMKRRNFTEAQMTAIRTAR